MEGTGRIDAPEQVSVVFQDARLLPWKRVLDNVVLGLAGADAEERGSGSRFQVVLDIIDRERPTVRQLLHRLAGARGHRVVAGTPEQIADRIQEWFDNGAADGFNVMPPWQPGGFDLFADHVVPILRERGLFRTEYTGTTLRDHYGLPRPDSQYAHRDRGQKKHP